MRLLLNWASAALHLRRHVQGKATRKHMTPAIGKVAGHALQHFGLAKKAARYDSINTYASHRHGSKHETQAKWLTVRAGAGWSPVHHDRPTALHAQLMARLPLRSLPACLVPSFLLSPSTRSWYSESDDALVSAGIARAALRRGRGRASRLVAADVAQVLAELLRQRRRRLRVECV